MTRIVIKELVWDAYNIEHIKKHNVTAQEIETVAFNLIARMRRQREVGMQYLAEQDRES